MSLIFSSFLTLPARASGTMLNGSTDCGSPYHVQKECYDFSPFRVIVVGFQEFLLIRLRKFTFIFIC